MTINDDVMTNGAFLLILLAFVVGAVVLAIVHAEQRRRDAAQTRADAEALARCERGGAHIWREYANYRFCAECPAREVQPFDQETAS